MFVSFTSPKRRLLTLSLGLLPLLLVSGCGPDPAIDVGIVNSPKLKIRSSNAMVAIDLAEVKQGDRLDVLEQTQVKTPTGPIEWYKVRTKDKNEVIGWVKTNEL